MLSKLSMFNRGASAKEAVVQRSALPPNYVKSMLGQFTFMTADQVAGFTCERVKSEREGAREDIKIFDGAGNLIYLGRNFDGRTISFWKP